MKKLKESTLLTLVTLFFVSTALAQQINDVNTPLHLLQPEYPTNYGKPEKEDIIKVIDRVYNYLNENTPAVLVDGKGKEITDFSKVDQRSKLEPGTFRLTSYEWGVTYAGMLELAKNTGDEKYKEYTVERLNFLSEVLSAYETFEKENNRSRHSLSRSLHPHALDDCGAICAAMIKTSKLQNSNELDWIIQRYVDYISEGQFRLTDGTLARNRPQDNTIWLDDMFMGVPALAQMGKYTGDWKYFNDAANQIKLFSERMFNFEKGLFMHGWVQEMEIHPQFHWGRANGWAIMAIVETLEVLPEDHPQRPYILNILKKHAEGLARLQDGTGFWHQLVDQKNTYLETSATAIYAYSIAKSINNGWLDAKAYGPMVCLAWNAVATKVNEKGQVEGTCVGTGMGFDPAFYYYRPVNVFAAHGYGPVLLAGAEIIELIEKYDLKINDSSLQFY